MVRVKGRDWYLFIEGADGDWSHEELDYDSSAAAGAGPRGDGDGIKIGPDLHHTMMSWGTASRPANLGLLQVLKGDLY